MIRLPFPTWRDLADTLASPDPDQRVTDEDAGLKDFIFAAADTCL